VRRRWSRSLRRPELEQALERLQTERAAEIEEQARRAIAADAKVQDLRNQLEEESRAAQENARRLQQAEAEYTALVVKSVRDPYKVHPIAGALIGGLSWSACLKERFCPVTERKPARFARARHVRFRN